VQWILKKDSALCNASRCTHRDLCLSAGKLASGAEPYFRPKIQPWKKDRVVCKSYEIKEAT
jgi:hypothetical protein